MAIIGHENLIRSGCRMICSFLFHNSYFDFFIRSYGPMKIFSEKKRNVPENRRKYGKPEDKKEARERLKKEAVDREKKLQMIEDIRNKNPDEFHFSYYSMNRSMTKRTVLDKEELKKILKYIDSEIKRCEKIIENTMKSRRINKHIRFDESKAEESVSESNEDFSEYEEYVRNLKEKRSEIVDKIAQR